MINLILNLPRKQKQKILVFADSVIIILILLLSFSIRLGYWFIPEERLLVVILGAPIIGIPIFISFKLYQSVTRYIGFRALTVVTQAVTLYALAWGLLGYLALIDGIPRSVILINWMLCIISIGGFRIIAQRILSYGDSKKNIKNVIIYGAGAAGVQLVRSLQSAPEFSTVAYLDDNEVLSGTYIDNIPVFHSSKIDFLVKKFNLKDIFLALPSVSRREKNKIISYLSNYSLHVHSLPNISELAGGKVKFNDLFEISIEDLLGRLSLDTNTELLKTNIDNKAVMVSGSGGSIGSEICRQIISLNPKILVLFELSEVSLYEINQELSELNINEIQIIPVLGSIKDRNKVKTIIKKFNIQTIYHAAAYKHVPLVEFNQCEGILNNSIGTYILAEEAIDAEVETFVLISTDKAVRPTSVMGASKRVAELTLQALAEKQHKTCLTMVRFGNVLGSSGSVIPLFKKQIKAGGPITITDLEIERYFMTIPEAVELVIQAGAMGEGGDVFVLDMGNPVKIYDLATKMINLSGLQVFNEANPDGDIEIQVTGLRPGEKLYEELLEGTNIIKTGNKHIMRAKETMIPWNELQPNLVNLKKASEDSNTKEAIRLLMKLVPEFTP